MKNVPSAAKAHRFMSLICTALKPVPFRRSAVSNYGATSVALAKLNW